jgi:predicted AAA+ superfamily ATPase
MYLRLLQTSQKQSFFLFGPRGVGKTAWLHRQLPGALFFDMLDHQVYTQLLAAPERLGERIPQGHKEWVVVDEIQRAPELLNEVHRLIESRKLRFALTGSSARKLRRKGVNLLAGRAVTRYMHPFTALELGKDFDLKRALRYGCLPLFAPATTLKIEELRGHISPRRSATGGIRPQHRRVQPFFEAASFSPGGG